MDAEKKLNTKRILIYLGITFLLTYLFEFLVIYPVAFSKNTIIASLANTLIALVMFIPAIGVLITRLITKEGFKNAWLKPNFKGHIKYYLMGWFGPAVLTLLGMGVYFVIFPEKFDGNFGYMQQLLAAVGQEMSPEMLKGTVIGQFVAAIFLGPILNAVNCFGEEWGWRGYLLPKMTEKFKIGWVLLITGIIWGLWHAPITAIGHNYGMGYTGWPVTGILAMCGFCIVGGTFLSFITLKTGSCLPAVLGHAGLNAIAGIGIYFTVDGGNPFIGPAPTGIIGGSAFLVTAIVMAIMLMKEKKCNLKL